MLASIILGGAMIPAYADPEGAPKTHTLFMGADFSIGIDKQLYPVRDVSGGSWVIDVGGRRRLVSTRNGPIDLKVTPSLKLTEISATIDKLTSVRGYTFGNDPNVRLTAGLSQVAATNADYQYNVSQANAVSAINNTMVTYLRNVAINSPDALFGEPTRLQDAVHAANENLLAQGSEAGVDLSPGGKKVQSDGFDAMEVTFEVFAERPLNSPYVVTLTRFHPKGGKPGVVQNLVYAKSLHPIDSHVTSIHILEGGFPLDFEVQDFQLHLYNQGTEIATNVAQKRVPLTRDEAFEYVKMEYIGAHANATLPPVPAMGQLPADLPAKLAGGGYGATYYVRISKDGLAQDAYLDAKCSHRVDDPYLESVVKNIRFKPALDKGRPVDGVAALKLGQLPI